MIITPALGIGDLLILKMHSISHKTDIEQIIISKRLLAIYRLQPEKYCDFVIILINHLFPNTKTSVTQNNNVTNLHSFDKCYLYYHYKFDKIYENPYTDYIIVHTKARFDSARHTFEQQIPAITEFFKTFKSKYTILLMGEKTVEPNREVVVHNIQPLYTQLIELNKNNILIDLTHNDLYAGNDYNDFEKELQFINQAKYNIGFGYGGPLNICMAFSKNNIFYIDNIKHQCVDQYKSINENLCVNINDFFDKIKHYC